LAVETPALDPNWGTGQPAAVAEEVDAVLGLAFAAPFLQALVSQQAAEQNDTFALKILPIQWLGYFYCGDIRHGCDALPRCT
jgi:hypothetical protein